MWLWPRAVLGEPLKVVSVGHVFLPVCPLIIPITVWRREHGIPKPGQTGLGGVLVAHCHCCCLVCAGI